MQTFFSRIVCCLLLFSLLPAEIFSIEQITKQDEIIISIHFENVTIKEALVRIEKNAPVTFAYNEKEVDVTTRVNGDFINASLWKVLDKLLIPNGLMYRSQGDMVLISPKPVKNSATKEGGIRGKVYDAETGEVLVGASIVVEGTFRGITSETNGEYILSGLLPGEYTIVVSFISYEKKRLENIRITSDNYTHLDVSLTPSSQNLGEVSVKGHIDVKAAPIKNTTELKFIESIRASDLMVTGISAEQIEKSLDSDAGDVMKRVPGVTVLNKFTIVRGMAPRYTKTYINGMQVYSTENFQRAVSLDLVPAGVINSINIYKLPAPELPGGFGGGVIQINTKQSQAARKIQVSLSGEYNTDYSFTDLYTGSLSDDKDWLASGASAREFPSAIYGGDRYSLPREEFYPEERMELFRQFKTNDLTPKFYRGNISAGINYYDSWLIGNVRINNLTAVGYSNKTDFKDYYRKYFNHINPTEGIMSTGIESRDSITEEKVRLNALESFNVVFNKNHKISFNLLANRNAKNTSNFRYYVKGSSGRGNADWLSDPWPKEVKLTYGYSINDILNGQVQGDHRFGKHHIQWNYAQSYFKSYAPLQESAKYRYEDYIEVPRGASISDVSKAFYKVVDKGHCGGFDYDFSPFANSTLKAGGLVSTMRRKATSAEYDLYAPEGAFHLMSGENKLWEDLSSTLLNLYNDDLSGLSWASYTAATSGENYFYDFDLSAAYLAWKQTFFDDKLQVYGGVRYENEKALLYDKNKIPITEYVYMGDEGAESLKLDIYNEYWLPSIYLTWNINDQQRIRGGYGKTLDRPYAREESFHEYYSPEEGTVYQGNQTLVNARIDNVDLRWEWYPSESEFIAVGAFYKYIDKPIESFEWQTESGTFYQYSANYRWAKLTGIEVEIRKNLAFIPISWADRFSTIANFSYTYTTINESMFAKTVVKWTENKDNSERPLTGSSPVILNANLYYADPKLKTQLALNYNYTGMLLLNVGDNDYGNLYQNAHGQLDFTAIQPIGKYTKIKVGLQNVFKKDITGWRDKDFDGEKHLDVQALNDGDSETDIGDALRITTDRKIYLGISFTF